MVGKPSHHLPTTKCSASDPEELQSAAALLESNLFVRASELLDRVTIAAKDTNGRIKWITLDPSYHSVLVRTAIATVKANSPKHSVASIKEALFTILLDILNGKQQQAFFTQLKREGPTKREPHKLSHPARRGSQTTASRKVNITPPLPPPPPALPPPAAPHASNHDTLCTLAPPENNPPSNTSPPSAPPQDHPPTLAHDSSAEDVEGLITQMENSTQEKLDIEAMLMEDLMEFERLNAELNSSKRDVKTTCTVPRKKASNAATASAAPEPSRPTTRQALKGRLKHTPRLNRI